MQTADSERRYLSVLDLARETGESIAVWRKRILQKSIAFTKLGRNVRVKRQDFEAFCAQRRVPAEAEPRVANDDLAGGTGRRRSRFGDRP